MARQQVQRAPEDLFLAERLGLREVGEPETEQAPDEGGRERKVKIGGNPRAERQLLGDPTPHGRVLDHHLLRREGVLRRLRGEEDQAFEELFNPVAVVRLDHPWSSPSALRCQWRAEHFNPPCPLPGGETAQGAKGFMFRLPAAGRRGDNRHARLSSQKDTRFGGSKREPASAPGALD